MSRLAMALLSIFVLSCDNGTNYPAKGIRLHFDRLIGYVGVQSGRNDTVTFYAVSYKREGNRIVLTCPCYSGNNEGFAAVELQGTGEILSVVLLPESPYRITITESDAVQIKLINVEANTGK